MCVRRVSAVVGGCGICCCGSVNVCAGELGHVRVGGQRLTSDVFSSLLLPFVFSDRVLLAACLANDLQGFACLYLTEVL